MTRQDDLSDVYAELKELKRQVRVLATAAPLGNSSITRGGLRVASPEGLTVQAVAGGIAMRITGTEVVDGTLRITGTFELAGTADITGVVNLTGDLNVIGAGRVKVGSSLVLNPAGSNGRIEFANGSQVFTDATTIQVYLGNGVVQVSNTDAKMQVGGTTLRVSSGHIYGSGMATRAAAATGLPAGVVGIDSGTGELFRVVP